MRHYTKAAALSDPRTPACVREALDEMDDTALVMLVIAPRPATGQHRVGVWLDGTDESGDPTEFYVIDDQGAMGGTVQHTARGSAFVKLDHIDTTLFLGYAVVESMLWDAADDEARWDAVDKSDRASTDIDGGAL
jgi:hypothetical protein